MIVASSLAHKTKDMTSKIRPTDVELSLTKRVNATI
jgi:hypothetical protein